MPYITLIASGTRGDRIDGHRERLQITLHLETIAAATGLTIEQLQQLQASPNNG
jgi:hypothetical protein